MHLPHRGDEKVYSRTRLQDLSGSGPLLQFDALDFLSKIL